MIKKILIALLLIFTNGSLKAQDWANIKHYADANSKVPPPATGEKRVIYMGDSITDFWIDNDSTFFAGKPYFDRGISGQTTGQMLLRFREDVINLKPVVVFILAGINDIAQNNGPSKLEDIFGNIVSMSQLARASHIKVVLSSLLPARTLPWRHAIDPQPQVKAINQMIKAYAEENGFIYLDYFTAMSVSNGGMLANLAKDDVHPNLNGYKAMEPLAEQAINAALKKKQR
ncbi:GDSL-type esterase/lipase family protein [Mucilaginibacter sp.]|uniref:GDSL-type esterase/lipase family protein n=1 Tax=Mucilaginibacter sp. TaxID=1882438 RepID=UPI0032666AA2